jgi:hypothetical protein
MEARAIYYHKNYNTFKEYNKGEIPYEITADVPNNWSNDKIWEEANKPCAIRSGYYLNRIELKNRAIKL